MIQNYKKNSKFLKELKTFKIVSLSFGINPSEVIEDLAWRLEKMAKSYHAPYRCQLFFPRKSLNGIGHNAVSSAVFSLIKRLIGFADQVQTDLSVLGKSRNPYGNGDFGRLPADGKRI